MKKLADEMESAGKKLDPEEFTSYVLAGLDMDYNSVVFTIVVHVEPIMPSGLLSQMLSHELCLEILQGGHGHQPSANSACGVMVDPLAREVVVATEVISLVVVGTAPRTTFTTDLNVSCVARLVMSSRSAGTGSITPSLVRRNLLMWLPILMASTQIGTRTRVLQTTSPAILTSFP
jgi:hypothetical protein